jgi:hypothetical protein
MRHKFVEFIPSKIEENVLYISIEYDVAKHKCACGCGADIVTTLSPARWQLTYDGETVSLHPSIGNWNHDCKSHYFIKRDKVVWAGSINPYEMDKVIKDDKVALKEHINNGANENLLIKLIKKLFRS